MLEQELLKKINENVDLKNIEKRLCKELEIEKEELYMIMLDVAILILDYTNQNAITLGLRTTFINMIKDYYYLNGYDKTKDNQDKTDESNDLKAKSISLGDTTVTFGDTQSQVNINGAYYTTGTIEFDKNILIDKYAQDLNRHRKMRW